MAATNGDASHGAAGAPSPEPSAPAGAGDGPCCRICLEHEPAATLIAPCNCAGSCALVHRECLDEWRACAKDRTAASTCGTCKFTFELEAEDDPSGDSRRSQCPLLALDLGLVLALAAMGALIYWTYLLNVAVRGLARVVGFLAYVSLVASWLDNFQARQDLALMLFIHGPGIALTAYRAWSGAALDPCVLALSFALASCEALSFVLVLTHVSELRDNLRRLIEFPDGQPLPRVRCLLASAQPAPRGPVCAPAGASDGACIMPAAPEPVAEPQPGRTAPAPGLPRLRAVGRAATTAAA